MKGLPRIAGLPYGFDGAAHHLCASLICALFLISSPDAMTVIPGAGW